MATGTNQPRQIKRNYLHVQLADGRDLQLETANPDLVQFDITAAKHKWPGPDVAAMLWATFITWHAAVRTKEYDGTWDKWRDEDCAHLEFTDKDGNPLQVDDNGQPLEPDDVDPTQPGADPA